MSESKYKISQMIDREWIAKMYDPNIEIPHIYWSVYDTISGYGPRTKFKTKQEAQRWILKKLWYVFSAYGQRCLHSRSIQEDS